MPLTGSAASGFAGTFVIGLSGLPGTTTTTTTSTTTTTPSGSTSVTFKDTGGASKTVTRTVTVPRRAR